MKNKEKYDLNCLKYVIIYKPYWKLYTIEVMDKESEVVLDTINTMKPEIEAIMEWLERECEEND